MPPLVPSDRKPRAVAACLNLMSTAVIKQPFSYVPTPSLEQDVIGLEAMKRALAILACLCVLAGGEYLAISKWAIRHETLNLLDASRQRPVSVDLAVRRDYEMKANYGFWKLPVAVISNGNTVRNTEYSFLANVLAARGYLVASIQQDLPSDPPLVTQAGMPYV